MPDNSTYTAIGAALGVGLAGAAAAVRQIFPNKTKERNEKAERDMISTLEHERDEARLEAQQERKQRTLDVRMIATLSAENVYLQRYLRKIVRTLPSEARQVVETDFTPLDELKP
ncbi:MAG TPA: hypothetical protein VNU48_07045 [Burkholderiaceae bacterium]|nr:hypothetical protein [Burkholderiaceae bacterium]